MEQAGSDIGWQGALPMGFFKKLTSIFGAPGGSYDPSYWLEVQCSRCGEIIRARVDMRNDLSIDYEDDIPRYYCRKVLMGEQRCFQQIEVELTFDSNHKLIDRRIRGGKFVDEPEPAG